MNRVESRSTSPAVFGIAMALVFATPMSGLTRQAPGASYQEIISAMGPDALGLQFDPDTLPDISTLTMSRFEDKSQNFIVEHPYTSGRWRGGKAVVEYARDLSYALV